MNTTRLNADTRAALDHAVAAETAYHRGPVHPVRLLMDARDMVAPGAKRVAQSEIAWALRELAYAAEYWTSEIEDAA